MKTNIKKYRPLTLPSDNNLLFKYIENNKLQMMECVLNSIEFALKKNLPVAEVFWFENSEFVVTLEQSSFLDNVNQVYSYYLEMEKYELCARAIKLKERLEKLKVKVSKLK